MDIEFKTATRSDLPYIVDVYNESIPGRMATADLEPISVGDRIDWFKQHEPGHRPLLVINYDDDRAGWLSLSSFYGRPAYEETVEISIYIDNHFQHKGIGNAAVNHAEKLAARLGIKTIVAFIFAHNAPSLHLFHKNNYEDWGHMPNVALMDGKQRSLNILGKRIVD
ncbi:GNAT family N-acetyltransferase (plasmid) [Nicoliella spurrieriana]|uniref:GNAT family N-acetyltransferase n=1 Tax=Nicoliella spurrieriana TaxID=2925830 RepID=A0A976RQE7_9LACO|nr:GNAT family N-acetyltransferase [Nicoliella spurrieriana]UQS85977.1 GNAT family N-acetyltransferase [Nicoliella spurrieriana]